MLVHKGPTVTARQVIAAIRPQFLESYLTDIGWSQVCLDDKNEKVAIYQKEEGDFVFEIRVPLDETHREYPIRIGDAVRGLAVAEGIPQTTVLVRIGQQLARCGSLSLN